VVQPYELFVKPANNVHHILIYSTIVSAVPLRRIEHAEQICGELTAELLSAEDLRFLMLLSASCLLWNKGVGAAEAQAEDAALMKKILVKAFEAFSQASSVSPIAFNFGVYSIFNLVNVTLSFGGRTLIGDR
jgi:hypothetical protein